MSAAYWAVFRAAVTVGVLSTLVKLVAMGKEALMAYRVGTAPELDAFLLAYALPAFLLNVLTGSLAAAYVPVYVRVRASEGEKSAAKLTATLTWLLAAALALSVIVLPPLFGALIGRFAVQYDPDTTALAVRIAYMLMPVLLLNGLTGFWSGFLNARKKFSAAALVPVATPAVVALALLFFWDAMGIYAVVAGTLAGGAIELAAIAVCARKEGLQIFSRSSGWTSGLGNVLPQFVAAAGSNLLIGATLLIDQLMAATLAPGSVAALGYGMRVPLVLVGIGSLALSTALLPHLSQLLAEQRFSQLRTLLRQYSLLTIVVSVLATLLLVIYSSDIVSLLFERGSFRQGDTRLVAYVQAAYAIHIPFFAWAMIAVRLISAMQANKFLVIGSAMSLVLDVLLNWVLSRYYGVAGIAMATSFVYFVACAYLWAVAILKLRHTARASVRLAQH